MAILNNDDIKIDNTPNHDGRRSLSKQVSDITDARKEILKQNSILNDRVRDFNDNKKSLDASMQTFNNQLDTLTKSLDKMDKDSAKAIRALLSSIGLTEKSMDKMSQTYKENSEALKKMSNDHTATGKQLLETLDSLDEVTNNIGDISEILEEIINNNYKLNKQQKETIKESAAIYKAYQQELKDAQEAKRNTYIDKEKVANENLSTAVKEEIGKLGDNLHQMIDTLNVYKLADKVAVSAKQQLQGELQTNYNLSGNEFESFKRGLYKQIDTSIYTNKEVFDAMQTLNTTALGNTQTATKYFNDIIRGQKVLGMTSETQQQLLKLGNITGRNELAFYQGTVAKFLNSNLGLNKQQLNELVQMNATLAMQAADLGIASEAFERANLESQAALERTEKGAGSRLVNAESFLLANTSATASLLGMDSGELSRRLNNGEHITDILRNSNGAAKEVMNAFRTGDTEYITRMREHASSAWGADNDAIWSTLRILATQEEEFNQNYLTATQSQTQDLENALNAVTEKETESLTWFQKALNKATNFFDGAIPWAFGAQLTSIIVGISTIISLMKINNNLLEIGRGLSGGKGAKLLSTKGLASKIGGLTIGNATGSAALGGALGVIGGTVMGISDAISMQGSTGYGVLADVGRGLFFGTGSKEQTNDQKLKSIGSNTLKYAAFGAGIGTFFGPGVGTAIGGGIGALVGLTTGLIGINKENKKLQEEQNNKLAEVEKNTATTANNTARDNVGIVYRYRGTDNYSSASGSGAIGSIGGSYHGYVSKGPIGAMTDAGKPITSYWGQKRTYKAEDGKWYTDIHNGADFGVPEGTKLYSNADGYVSMNFTEKSGANIVGITDKAGYTHLYAHMQSRSPLKIGTEVHKGDFVGYSGKTGRVTGAHLHYTVLKPGQEARNNYWVLGNTIDPAPFVSSSIFNGDASTVISSANKASTNSNVSDILGRNSAILSLESLGSISGPVVNSITDLKQTIIDLSAKTDRNEKILNMLTNKMPESPIA